MGKEARIALLLTCTACLLAVMVEWMVSELQHSDSTLPVSGQRPAGC
jgi:hypothetical protein